MSESMHTIADAEKCRFVFQQHARAVVHIPDLTDEEVLAFAELAEATVSLDDAKGPPDDGEGPPGDREGDASPEEAKTPPTQTLRLVDDAAPRFRAIWRKHLSRLKATCEEAEEPAPEPEPEPSPADLPHTLMSDQE